MTRYILTCVPTVPVYIRKDDYDKWRAIERPSEFIHNALNGVGETREIAPMRPLTQEDVSAMGADLAKRLQQDRESKPAKTPNQVHAMGGKLSDGKNFSTIIKTPKVTDSDINRISKQMDKATKPEYITPIIRSPKDAEKAVASREPIPKSFSARRKKNG